MTSELVADRPLVQAGRRAAAGTGAVADRTGRLAPATATALIGAGFARHFVPVRSGGHEGGFGDVLTAVTATAEECASAAWCAALWAWHARFAALLPAEGQAELWARSPDVPVAAGLVPAAAGAEVAPGGLRLHGRWNCVSGVEYAEWILLVAPTPDGTSLVLAVPRAECAIENTWRAAGLRATGSDTVVVQGAVVPAYRTMDLAYMMRGNEAPDASRCHAAPAHLAGGLLLAAVGVGAGRAAAAAWRADRPLGGSVAAEMATALARSEAELDAAALVLRVAADRADNSPVTQAAVARNRRDAAFAADLTVSAVECLLRTAGSYVRDSESAVNRAWRDVHTAAAHGALRFPAAAQAYAAAVDQCDLL